MKIRPMQIAISQPSRHSGFFISWAFPLGLFKAMCDKTKQIHESTILKYGTFVITF